MTAAAYEISQRQTHPYASICYVQVVYPDGWAARASAVVVGLNDVLTALHVVYQAQHGGWATSISIVPGADTTPWSAPYGTYTDMGMVTARASTWDFNGDGRVSPAESGGDLALIGLTTRIGDVTGWLPVVQQSSGFYGVTTGYPASGTGLMEERVYAAAMSLYSIYYTAACLGPGASGGPLLVGTGTEMAVAGVLSGGTADNALGVYAGLFGSATWEWLHDAMAANDHLIGEVPLRALTSAMINVGTAGADALVGGLARDTFNGLGGNDSIDGNEGVDTAVYAGERASYTVIRSGDALVVADRVAGRDGTDTLRDVERLAFADVHVAFDVDGAAGQAYRLYEAAFNRAPDLAGLGFQIGALEAGHTLVEVTGNFLASPEFLRTYATPDDRTYIELLYRNVLDRAPGEAEVQHHLATLHSDGATRAHVLVHFSESPENQAALIGVMSQGMVYTT